MSQASGQSRDDEAVLRARAARLARPAQAARAEGVAVAVLRLGAQRYAVPMRRTVAVQSTAGAARIPGGRPWLSWAFGHRDRLVCLLDLEALVAGQTVALRRHALLVDDPIDGVVGLLADEVVDVANRPEGAFAPLLDGQRAGHRHVAGVDDEGILLLDLEALLRDPRLAPHEPRHATPAAGAGQGGPR